MRDVLFLAWRYVSFHRIKSVALLGSITLILFLPAGLRVLVQQSERELTTRADATPVLLGAKGSPLELVLSSLYFESDPPTRTTWAEHDRIADSGLARAIPLYARFRCGPWPIVGTTLDYFDWRGLQVAEGRMFAVLGECVLGSAVASDLGLGPGDTLVSSPETVFDLAGVYPLRMRIAGVLAPSHGPDDRALFADVKTTWVIEGLGHGHQDLTTPGAASGVLRRDGDTIVANASVVQYNEIDAENLGSFHFHGDLSGFPLTAVIAVPPDDKSSALLRGRYLGPEEAVQVVRPREVMNELLATIFTVQTYVVAAVVVLGASTLVTTALVFVLSLRLRRREIDTMFRIGAARGRVAGVLAMEIAGILGASLVLAAILTAITARFGSEAIRAFLLT